MKINPSVAEALLVLQQIQDINTTYRITPREAKILDLVVDAHISGNKTYIGDVLEKSDLATNKTIRKDLLSLHEKNLLAIAVDQGDARKRFIQPSASALHRLKALDMILS